MTESASADRINSRKTTLLVGAVLGAIGLWNVHRGRIPVAVTLGGLSSLLIAVGLFLPSWAHRFHKAWMAFASKLGFVQSRILLSMAYYGVATPLGLILRITGRDDLGRRGAQKTSYWVQRGISRQTKEGFEKPF